MLEMLMNPKKAERKPIEMLFIGLLYSSLSVLLVKMVFGKDPVLSQYSGIFMITFCVIFSIPFMYYMIKLEEQRDLQEDETPFRLLKEHSRAIMALLWLFVGFIIAFSFWYIVLPDGEINFKAQIETFCHINHPSDFETCVSQYLNPQINSNSVTGAVASTDRVIAIFANNSYVLMFTLFFSLIFGAGAIFILAWNASVIAAAIGIFAKSQISNIPLGVMRYMIHGLPEIAAYFIAALAGGILSVAIIRRKSAGDRFWSVVQDSLNMIVVAIVILLLAALIEVFITPIIF